MDKQQLIDGLNGDLAGELQAVIMYTIYSAQVKGPYRPQLVQFMQAEIADELLHARFLADKIVSLGGTPTTSPRPVPAAAGAKEMLENILKAEEQAIRDYSARSEQARSQGELGLSVQLETMVQDETSHYEETKKLLAEWH
ncbi:MAG: ferritin-like domain-containing protein [Chloroflexi bacterium]|nr:ferritin-like domain-containing protein [Chloroflexota bacterium]